ncbi:MAG: 6-carboxytetrahydropterin synthase [Bacteroidales bacterium]|jgi:6-pyruvoyltetrahydropterin/6-carboxytetrahydropterin synthase|nr:6-carboxytetrahydropterin synthase [Bacteroidales bacterium]
MGKIRITKLFTFEMAHALKGHDGLCSNIHGHSYKLRVTVVGNTVDNSDSPKDGMLIDFADLKHIVKKSIVDKYDHALVLNSTTDMTVLNMLKGHYDKIVIVDYQPTSEQMLMDFANILQQELPSTINLYSLRLSETETSYAEWFAEDK